MPFRKKALSPEQHIKFLRVSIILVALFAFSFSWWYNPNQAILMVFSILGTIWGGADAVIISNSVRDHTDDGRVLKDGEE